MTKYEPGAYVMGLTVFDQSVTHSTVLYLVLWWLYDEFQLHVCGQFTNIPRVVSLAPGQS